MRFTGIFTTSYSDGVVKSTTQHEDGVKQGEYREYYHHGELGAKGNFENGYFRGKYGRFSPSGSVILTAEINHKGAGEMSEYNFSGAVLVHGKFKNWRKSGVWKNLIYKGDVLKETKFNPSSSSDEETVLIEEFGFGN
jgi:antitoxin component YwqK of YwqJK toxin-antitoxin module